MHNRSGSRPFVCLGMLMLGLSKPTVSGQSFSIPVSTMAGGGGASSGGAYAVQGTIGQSVVGEAMKGGAYSLTGGFWPGIGLVQTPDAPKLSFELLPGGGGRVLWPTPAAGWVLEQAPALALPPDATAWNRVALPYETNATQISITVAPDRGIRLYRLRKP